MDISAPIIAAHSLAGIVLGSDVELVLNDAYSSGLKVAFSIHDNPSIKLHSYKFEDGIITVNADENGTIVSISCRSPYSGLYQQKLKPSMSMAQIKAVTQKQLLTCGALVLDGEFGMFFTVPQPYDEYDYSRTIPDDLVLDEIYVMHRNWRGY